MACHIAPLHPGRARVGGRARRAADEAAASQSRPSNRRHRWRGGMGRRGADGTLWPGPHAGTDGGQFLGRIGREGVVHRGGKRDPAGRKAPGAGGAASRRAQRPHLARRLHRAGVGPGARGPTGQVPAVPRHHQCARRRPRHASRCRRQCRPLARSLADGKQDRGRPLAFRGCPAACRPWTRGTAAGTVNRRPHRPQLAADADRLADGVVAAGRCLSGAVDSAAGHLGRRRARRADAAPRRSRPSRAGTEADRLQSGFSGMYRRWAKGSTRWC